MSETKGLLKKRKLLKTLMYKYRPLQILLIVFVYAVIVFINIPINKWLSLNCPEWSSGEYCFWDAFWILPFTELASCFIVFVTICSVILFVTGIIAYSNYCYIPLTEEEIKEKGFKNADEYFAYVCAICSYGFKNDKFYVQIDNEDLQKLLTACLKVFSDNGTIFGIDRDMAVNITENSDFLSALKLASDKKAEIRDDYVVLSGKTKDGEKKEYKI